MKWVCSVCGYVHEGPEAPESCPLCKAPKEKFVKQAGENPYEKALWRYSVGSCYVGMVSMVDINGVFVALDEGVDCLCSYPKRGRPPRGARVTVRILGINKESNRIWGAITHIAAAR